MFYVFTASVARLSHLDIDLTVRHIREVTYECYIASAVMVFLICRKLRCPLSLAAAAAIMMLAQPDFLGWNVTVRPNLTALFLSIADLT